MSPRLAGMVLRHCAQDQYRAGCLLHHFLRHRAKGNPAPTGHAVGGDDDHVGVVVLRNAHQFHAHVVRCRLPCAHLDF